jgi:predicted RNA binding protein YcfA (HicA-like mRNA interferase family)
MKARRLVAVLMREPLGYRVARQRGSHRVMVSDRHPPFVFAYHDSRTLTPWQVRTILVEHVGLEEHEALDLL